jgi:hypothetical protein
MFNRIIRVIALTLILELIVGGALLYFKVLTFDEKTGLTALVVILGFVITIIQLQQSIALQKGNFVKDYVSQFFTNPELYRIWHELIYTYDNTTFEKIDARMKERHLGRRPRPVIDDLSDFQGARQVGARFYHPALFQGSEEEKRLDIILGYFDVIGYHYSRNLIGLKDIAGSFGYFLSMTRARAVVQAYLDLSKREWQAPDYRVITPTPPFAFLQRLLEDLDAYNRRYEVAIRKMYDKRL